MPSSSSPLPPDAIALVLARAFALAQSGDAERARVLFRGLRILVADAIEPPRGEAVACLLLEDGIGARDAAQIAIARAQARGLAPADYAELEALLAKAHLSLGDHKSARSVAEEAIEHARASPDAHAEWLAPLELGLRTVPTATTATPLPPDVIDGQRALLDAAIRGERPLANAVGLDDETLLRWYDEGIRLLQVNAAEDAQRIFRGLVALDATAPLFHFAFAAASDLLGENLTAQNAYDRAVIVAGATAPHLHAAAFLRRARFRFASGDLALALQDAERAIALEAPEWIAGERKQAEEIVEAARRLGG